MGFFNKILKGLGFEDEEENTRSNAKAEKKKKEKVKVNNNVYASFDLNEEEISQKQKNEKVNEPVQETITEPVQTESSFSIIKVKSQVEVQDVVVKIKSGERVLINLSGMSGADITRSLDFLTGAVFALDKTMQKVDGNVYLIQ